VSTAAPARRRAPRRARQRRGAARCGLRALPPRADKTDDGRQAGRRGRHYQSEADRLLGQPL